MPLFSTAPSEQGASWGICVESKILAAASRYSEASGSPPILEFLAMLNKKKMLNMP
jgi:hypothetical protein